MAETVYTFSDDLSDPVQKGTFISRDGPDEWINFSRRQSRIHRTNVFSPLEVAEITLDLLPTVQDGKEITLDDAIDIMLDNSDTAKEVYVRLAAKALVDYYTSPRTPEDYGIKAKEELIGAITKRGSNIWKIEDLIEGARIGRMSPGVNNNLNLVYLSDDVELLSDEEMEEVEAQAFARNRQVLDELYDRYEVDFHGAEAFERHLPGGTERVTIYPSQVADFCFVEKSRYYEDEDGVAGEIPNSTVAQIVVGRPKEYTLEQGYLPVV